MRVVIVGSTGYGGIELIRLCQDHPELEFGALISTSAADEPIGAVYPHLSHLEVSLSGMTEDGIAAAGEVVFFATPAGVSSEWLPRLREKGLICIDLSGDFRLDSPEVYETWYSRPGPDEAYLAQAVYGLCEWNADAIRASDLISNPGCYPTAALLGLLPLLHRRLIEPQSIMIDGKSGASGAGRSAKTPLLFTEINENVRPYKVDGHQHIPEIELGGQRFADQDVQVMFTPHLIPMSRGICCTMYATLADGVTAAQIADAFQTQYEAAPFVRLRPEGHWPQTKDVSGSNYCDIGFYVDTRTGRVVVMSVVDNLVKGASGQAIQNLNIRMGWPETTGLTGSPVYP